MQDVTNLAFMHVLHGYGDPDYYFNEYFRVHEHSRLDEGVLAAITGNPTGRPIFAQFIGEDLDSFARMLTYLKPYPVAGVDLNLGCPAPKVYKKCVGGGLLRDLKRTDVVLGFLREHIEGRFTVKCRLGFDSAEPFEELLRLINKHAVDALSVHGRTVKQMYRGEVDYSRIRMAVQQVNCPVFANGNISSARKALDVQTYTGCHGLMIGRAAIRNPWIFRQIRECYSGEEAFAPTLANVRDYVTQLFTATERPGLPPRHQLGAMKKLLNFVSQGVDPEGSFQFEMRRARSPEELAQIADKHLLGEHADKPFSCEPYTNVLARPNCEG